MSTATLNRISHWREATIGDALARIESGVSPKAMDRPAGPDEYGVLKVSAVTWDDFRPEENKALFPEFDTSNISVVNAGDLLLSRANTAELLASPVLVPRDYHNLILSDKTLRLVPRRDVADTRFLLYALRQPKARQYFLSHATGTSGSMRNVSQDTIRNCPIPLPPLPEQKRIADILDKADAIRRKRQEACDVTEEIVKSAFLDTFGDPVNNPHDWPLKPLGDVVAKLTDGEHLNPTFTGIGMPMIMAANVLHEGVSFEGIKHVTSEDGMRFRKKCGPDRDDLLVVSRGATIGRCSIVDTDTTFCLMGSVILLKPNNDVACATYLKWLFTHHGYYNKLFKTSGSSAQQAIYLTHLRDLVIPIPRIELQRRFASQVEAVRSVRQKSERALVETTGLFNSLVQRAFKGEL